MVLALEDKRIQLVEDSMQELVNQLCKEYQVPNIPVIFNPNPIDGLDNLGGMFKREEYIILISINADILTLVHEFFHYLERIVSVADNVEEKLVQWSTLGFKSEVTNLKVTPEHTMTGKLLKEAQKKLEDIQKENE